MAKNSYSVPVYRPSVKEDDPDRGQTTVRPNEELIQCRGIDLYNFVRKHHDPGDDSYPPDHRVVEIVCDDDDQMYFKDAKARGTKVLQGRNGVDPITHGDLPGTYTSLHDLANGRVKRPDLMKSFWINCQCGTTNPVGVATGAFQAEGTPTSYMDSSTSWTQYQSDAVSGVAGLRSGNFNILRLAHSPLFLARIKTNQVLSNMRIMVGLFSAAPSGDDMADYHVAFRYSTTEPIPNGFDNGWVASVKDGVNQKFAPIQNGTVNDPLRMHEISGDGDYLLALRVDAVERKAYFSINGGSLNYSDASGAFKLGREVVIDTNLPANEIDLGFAVRVQDLALDSRVLRISRMYCEHE